MIQTVPFLGNHTGFELSSSWHWYHVTFHRLLIKYLFQFQRSIFMVRSQYLISRSEILPWVLERSQGTKPRMPHGRKSRTLVAPAPGPQHRGAMWAKALEAGIQKAGKGGCHSLSWQAQKAQAPVTGWPSNRSVSLCGSSLGQSAACLQGQAVPLC